MQHLKRKVRRGNNPAARLVKKVFESMEMDAIPDQEKIEKIIYKRPNVYQTNRGKFCEVIQPVILPLLAFCKSKITQLRQLRLMNLKKVYEISLSPCQQNCIYSSATQLSYTASFHRPKVSQAKHIYTFSFLL